MTITPNEHERKAVIDAVLNLFGASKTESFLLPIPGTNPQLYVVSGDLEGMRALVELTPQEAHPLDGTHINQGSMDAAADAYEAEYKAAHQPAAVEGWVMVPMDATPEMIAASHKVDMANDDTEGFIHNVWHALLSAAPTPPSAPVQQSVTDDFRNAQWQQAAWISNWIIGHGLVEAIHAPAFAELQDHLAAFSTSPLLDKNDQAEATVRYVGISDSDAPEPYHTHPNDDEPRCERLIQRFRVMAEGVGQGLHPYWKWAYASGYNAAKRDFPQPPQPDSNELVEALAEARRERDKFYGEANIERQNSAELKANSDRYLFLRNQTINEDMCPPIDGLFIGQVPQNVVLTFEHADAAIDAALAQSPSVGTGA